MTVWLEPERKPESRNEGLELEQIIPRIIAERGTFALLSEESLQYEIQRQRAELEVNQGLKGGESGEVAIIAENTVEEANKVDETEEDETHIEGKSFHEARKELVELVHLAQNEAALSLDLVGLLLSGKVTSSTGTNATSTSVSGAIASAGATTTSTTGSSTSNTSSNSTMSEFLRERVPPGSLGIDRLDTPKKEGDWALASGWKAQALNRCSQRFRESAERLNMEIRRENRYWHQVLDTVVNGGEVVFRIRRGDTRSLAIKYGYNDSGSEFRERGGGGVAIIRRNAQTGAMMFSPASVSRRETGKCVRLSIYKLTGAEVTKVSESSVLHLKPEGDDDDAEENEDSDDLTTERAKVLVENQISNARALLFEEELFYEMVHEARQLGAYRIEIADGKIRAMVVNEMVEIEYVDCSPTTDDVLLDNKPDNSEPEQLPIETETVPPNYRRRADVLVNTLRLLQCLSYKRNLAESHRRPAALSSSEEAAAKKTRNTSYILRPLLSHLHHHKMETRLDRLLRVTFDEASGARIEQTKPTMSSKQPKILTVPQTHFKVVGPDDRYSVKVTIGSLFQTNKPLFAAQTTKQGQETNIEFYELSELEHYLTWFASTV